MFNNDELWKGIYRREYIGWCYVLGVLEIYE